MVVAKTQQFKTSKLNLLQLVKLHVKLKQLLKFDINFTSVERVDYDPGQSHHQKAPSE